jgi:hypothetical protein
MLGSQGDTMQNRIPLPTDNIYKFYALFGLILFIFGFSSMIFLNKSTNDLVYKTVISVEALESIDKRSPIQEAELAIIKKKQKIALSDKQFFLYCIGCLIGGALLLMYYGFHRWHTKIQPLQDELTELTVKKLRNELRVSVPNKIINKIKK